MDRSEIFADLMQEYHKLKFNPETGEVEDAQIGLDGREYLDPTPMAPPLGYKRQPTMVENIREMIRNERLARELAAAGYETFEESEDFDIGDDYDPRTPFENDFDPPISEIAKSVDADKAAKAEAAKKSEPQPVVPPAQNP